MSDLGTLGGLKRTGHSVAKLDVPPLRVLVPLLVSRGALLGNNNHCKGLNDNCDSAPGHHFKSVDNCGHQHCNPQALAKPIQIALKGELHLLVTRNR